MAQRIDIEQGPSSSYSDPIYDRLDTVAQRISRRWPLLVLLLLIIVATAVTLRMAFFRSPSAASASAYVEAMEAEGDDAKLAALKKLVDDAAATDYFRGRAACELVQDALDKKQPAEAKKYAEQAVAFAAKGGDADLQLNARLSLAAAHEDAGEYADALKSYRDVASSAGGKFPSQQLAAVLGAARTLQAQGLIDEAVTQLESVINRNDSGAEALLDYARVLYWQLKRAQESKPEAEEAKPAEEAKSAEEAKAAEVPAK